MKYDVSLKFTQSKSSQHILKHERWLPCFSSFPWHHLERWISLVLVFKQQKKCCEWKNNYKYFFSLSITSSLSLYGRKGKKKLSENLLFIINGAAISSDNWLEDLEGFHCHVAEFSGKGKSSTTNEIESTLTFNWLFILSLHVLTNELIICCMCDIVCNENVKVTS